MIEIDSILVSIIMPTFNRGELIAESIESILVQTHRNIELIIIDDASTDDTEKRVLLLADKRIRYFKCDPIHDLVQLRLKGIEKANGEMIAFADSDDLWAENKLSRQLAIFQIFPDCDLVLTGGYNFRQRNIPEEYFYKSEAIRFGFLTDDLFRSKLTAILPSILMKRKCVENFAQHSHLKTDIDLLIELLHSRKAAVLQEHLYFRRIHPTNMHTTAIEKSFASMKETISRCKEKNYIDADPARQTLYELYLRFGDKYKRNGQKGKARQCYVSAWLIYPYKLTGIKRLVTS